MKILLINKFLYPKGGDAVSTLNTGALLTAKGHNVNYWGMAHPDNPGYPHAEFFVDNVDYYQSGGVSRQIKMAGNVLYSLEAKRKVERMISAVQPDIAHLNNFAHQISPSILHVFKKYKIPMVMTMHDYKLVCPVYSMLSDGKICEKCRGGRYYHCLINKCAKGSGLKSALNTGEMYLHHKILRMYDLVDAFISPSQFLKEKVTEMGFKGRIEHLSNFVKIDNFAPYDSREDNNIVYVGRLSAEKGLFTLVEAVKHMDLQVKIIGSGSLRENIAARIKDEGINNIRLSGFIKGKELREEIKKALFIIQPSECYENNPLSILEAFAYGKPVIGSRIGGIPELVKDNVTGLTFEPGNVEDLRSKIAGLLENPRKRMEMGKNARKMVEEKFNPALHHEKLMEIYRSVLN